MAMGYLDSPSTKNEACLAAVAIAETIASKGSAEVAGAMEKVLAAAANDDVKNAPKQCSIRSNEPGDCNRACELVARDTLNDWCHSECNEESGFGRRDYRCEARCFVPGDSA